MENMDGALIDGSVQQLQQQQERQRAVTKKKSKNKKKNSSNEVVKETSATCNSTTRKPTTKPRTNVSDGESKINENCLSHHLKQQLHLDEQVNGLVITLGNVNKKQSTTTDQTPANHYCKVINNSNSNATISNAATTTTIIPTIRPVVNSKDMEELQPAPKLNGHHCPPVSTCVLLSNEQNNVRDNVNGKVTTLTAKKSKRKANQKKQPQSNNASSNCNNSSRSTNKHGNKEDRDSQKIGEVVVTATEITCSNNCGTLTTCVYNEIEENDQGVQMQQLCNGYLPSVAVEEMEEQKRSKHSDNYSSSHINTTTTTTANNICNSSSAPTNQIINNNNDKKIINTTNSNNINSETQSQQQQQEQESIALDANNATSMKDLSAAHIEYKEYESELQMHDIMRLIQAELSEPYSIYTYRYFIYNWPKLCFLAAHGNDYVGAIVCKLDMHLNVRRGYIAMLAVRKEYRKLKIGTTLVQKAIEAMLADNADEVVLETEMSNVPALRLYENLGFVRDKRLFRYYLNGVDALRLKLWFR